MKVVLLRDVAKIGRRNEVVEVPDGYALNQLIPKKWAEAATPTNLKKVAAQKSVTTLHHKLEEDQFASAVKTLSGAPLKVIVGQANEQGHLFKAVHEAEIVAAAKLRGVTLLPAQIHITTPLKSLGVHEITLTHKSTSAVIAVEISKS